MCGISTNAERATCSRARFDLRRLCKFLIPHPTINSLLFHRCASPGFCSEVKFPIRGFYADLPGISQSEKLNGGQELSSIRTMRQLLPSAFQE
jgi:hypothetical protein